MRNEIVKVNNQEVPVIEWNNERVITTAQLADVYGADIKVVSNNFNRNKRRFEEGKHYYLLQGKELSKFKTSHQNDEWLKHLSHLYLWTKRGASRHCKILGTDKAWEQFDFLEEAYFNPQRLMQMEDYKMPQKDKTSHKEKLPSVNQMVKNIKGALHDAGVDSKYIAAEVVRIYSDNGYPVKVPLISDEPVLWDCTTIAKELGIYSESGRPHDKAVSAIIQKLSVLESEIVKTAYSRNGHDGVTVQYKDSVMQKIKLWLQENGYPTVIEYRLSNGNTNKCKVVYQEVA